MRKTRASQASSSEKLMRLKQELATAADLVTAILKREQLKREASQQAKAVWEKREDFANLKRKFPSLLNAKEDEELFYDKVRVVKPPGQSYVPFLSVKYPSLWVFQSPCGCQAQSARQHWRSRVPWTAP